MEQEIHTSSPRTRFIIRRITPALTQAEGFASGHHSVTFQIGLVAYNNDRHMLIVFDADDLLAELLELFKRGARGDGKDEEEALAGFHVELS